MRVLIAEDDYTSRKVLENLLSQSAQCDVTVNGEEVMEVFKNSLESGIRYDLICLDILMPKLDGLQVLKSIRAEEERRGILGLDGVKVIMTTGLDGSKDVMEAFRSGCEAYIVKPIRAEKLREMVAKLGLK